ncbi:hypothetical protein TKK_0016688 [Trichogramma kaykai]|uniref:Uncharacterized protein n=1 Tax=Trichogramma kaykai TaxID=54128 RepID=A0ABD2W607_9HYME
MNNQNQHPNPDGNVGDGGDNGVEEMEDEWQLDPDYGEAVVEFEENFEVEAYQKKRKRGSKGNSAKRWNFIQQDCRIAVEIMVQQIQAIRTNACRRANNYWRWRGRGGQNRGRRGPGRGGQNRGRRGRRGQARGGIQPAPRGQRGPEGEPLYQGPHRGVGQRGQPRIGGHPGGRGQLQGGGQANRQERHENPEHR